MKLTGVALVCLLLAAMYLQGSDSASMHVSSSNCCYKLLEKKIPQRLIRCYKSTSSSCPYKDRVIFKMKGGQERCALKTEKWVEYYLKKVKPC
ncbi:PREDICTED: C-C motif chemokine 1 [Condylura cristata]|uniref:C-C motif chemokine 1 n=1 Tax=Condylura cristata TaxID=143302 RepID=UPI0003346BDB|nr:PREDICTED: C-C motif chemokine 1 [Condylura cristata]